MVAPIRGDETRLDVGEEGILLRFVEAMNLVDEEESRLAPCLRGCLRSGHDLADLGHSRSDRRVGDETTPGELGDEAGKGRLAASRWTPEDERGNLPRLDRQPERPLGTHQVLLSHQLVEGPRADPIGQWRLR